MQPKNDVWGGKAPSKNIVTYGLYYENILLIVSDDSKWFVHYKCSLGE
jgi:hypothetical protein